MQYLQHTENFINNIKVVEISGHPDGLTFFCMHGYGANAYDLAGLSQVLKFSPRARLLFPDGILPVDLGMMQTAGRAWFPIDFNEIERIRQEGGLRDLSKNLPTGMDIARDQVIEVMAKLDIKPEKTILAGFSQGAMMATELALHHPEYFKGLIIFSGTLVNKEGWREKLAKKYQEQNRTLHFIASHGKNDMLLPFAASERLYKLLTDHGAQGELVAFNGGHEIPLEVIDKVNAWLQDRSDT